MAVPGAFAGFWASLGERERQLLLGAGHERRVAPGRRLYDEGQRAPSVVVVLQGRLKVSTLTWDGEERLLAWRGTGDLLGEMAALTDRPRTADVTAIDAVRALVVPAEEFEGLWRREPVIAAALVQALVHRVEEADRARLEQSDPAPVRVRRLLGDLARRWSRDAARPGLEVDLPFTQEELASLACTSRSVVASVFRELREEGVVRTARRRVIVVDPARLPGGPSPTSE